MMRSGRLLVLAALAGIAPVPVQAQTYTFMSGADLAERCLVDQTDPEQVANFSFCIGYIRATFDRMWIAEVEAGNRPQDCLPEELSNRAIIDAVIAEMERHPPGNGILASQLVREVLMVMNPGCFG
jgi:hypothetical protein